jgi:quercetin dioxygenase-like cupin family protein
LRDRARERALEVFAEEDLEPTTWSNGPDVVYAEHTHDYHKVLVCIAGSIVFHTPEEDVSLEAGGRIDLAAGTRHSAEVGPRGVTCMEAARPTRSRPAR